jgi:hypothetical protein
VPTTRTPINRIKRGPRLTPEAIAAFKHLRAVYEEGGCTCPPRPPDPYPPKQRQPEDPLFEDDPPPRCEACQRYDQAEGEVMSFLRLKPWQMLLNPYFGNPYPRGTPAWQRREDQRKGEHDNDSFTGGYRLWWQLEAACGLERLQFDDDDDP